MSNTILEQIAAIELLRDAFEIQWGQRLQEMFATIIASLRELEAASTRIAKLDEQLGLEKKSSTEAIELLHRAWSRQNDAFRARIAQLTGFS